MQISIMAATVAAAIACLVTLFIALVLAAIPGGGVSWWKMAGGAFILLIGLSVWIYHALHVVACD